MKTLHLMVLCFVLILSSAPNSWAAIDPQPSRPEIGPILDPPVAAQSTPAILHPNGVQTARAFLANGEILALNCGFRFTAVITPGSSNTAEGEFTLAMTGVNKGFITRMLFNGNELIGPNDPPLPGFPFFSALQIKDLNIWVSSVKTPNDTANIYGGFYVQEFTPRTPIVITLRPGWMPVFIPYAGGNASLSISWYCGADGTDGGEGSADYDTTRKGFLVWVDPTKPYRCEVSDRNNRGVILDRLGPYIYGQTLPGQSNDSALNVAYPDGIEVASLGTNGWCVLSGLKPKALAQDGITPAGVYGINIPDGYGLAVDVERLPVGAQVKVFGYVEVGELPEIPVTITTVVNQSGQEVGRYAYAQVNAKAYP